MKAALAMQPDLQYRLFDDRLARELERLVDIDLTRTVSDYSSEPDEVLADIEVLVTGWFAPAVDGRVLDRMPRLRAILHAGGSVKGMTTPEVWDRGILVTTAADANAVPVAEYALAMVLLAGKKVLPIAQEYARRQSFVDLENEYPQIGAYRSTVGIIGASRTGRHLIRLLGPFSYRVLVSDPYLSHEEAAVLGVEKVELDELLNRSRVVSLHAPDLPSTRGLLGRREFALLGDGATFINTARQALVDQDALLGELRSGRLDAVLDVTDPEPLNEDHPFFAFPNVLVTPHIAGSRGTELLLLGEAVVEEARRLRDGLPPAFPVAAESLATIA
ncbi:hydroxyacid dehydrogenase [Rathayibacter sp. SD072]|uniref:hydroxyacid dehydrogenase n=1 Tax=Rathayibacter sp. SD072 TaxID=2781731 RepID=UPI001A97858B|nr:hydroxyacid dehydrogenase [Rathayibacter sp. SD072]MBO0984575.1 hydroxyacid dehydrogenase [Rathayibacter sp. SD072]